MPAAPMPADQMPAEDPMPADPLPADPLPATNEQDETASDLKTYRKSNSIFTCEVLVIWCLVFSVFMYFPMCQICLLATACFLNKS